MKFSRFPIRFVFRRQLSGRFKTRKGMFGGERFMFLGFGAKGFHVLSDLDDCPERHHDIQKF